MPTGAEGPDALCDTSVAVPLVVVDHEHHARTAEALRGRRLGLCGHAAFETFSVLTRLPPPIRRSPTIVRDILVRSFPHSRFLRPESAARLLEQLGASGVSGGAVHDALVAATALDHGVPLLTRDVRAAETYRALDAHFELLG
jgi:predicted nucleic acid-binding protein